MPNPTMKKPAGAGTAAAKQALKQKIMQVMQPAVEPALMPQTVAAPVATQQPAEPMYGSVDSGFTGENDYRDWAEYKFGRWQNAQGEDVDPTDKNYKFIGRGSANHSVSGELPITRGKYAKTGK